MTQSANKTRVRLSAAALVIAGILFVFYPAIRPFSDETSLQGAAAFASTEWVLAHLLAIAAFTLLPIGLLGLQNSMQQTAAERQGYWAVVLSWIGVALTLPFYGEEAYGLHVIGQEAIRQQSTALLTLVGVMGRAPAPSCSLSDSCYSALPQSCGRRDLAIWHLFEVERHTLRGRGRAVHSAVFLDPALASNSWSVGRDRLCVGSRGLLETE